MRALIATAMLITSVADANAPKGPAPLVHAPLDWTVTPDAGHKALTGAKLKPEHGERRGYFSDGKGGVAHTTEPELHWKIPHGRAEARFQWNDTAKDFLLDEVQLLRDLTDTQLSAELAALEKKHGKPDKTTPDFTVWARGGFRLVVISGKKPDENTGLWYFSVHYRRDARPVP